MPGEAERLLEVEVPAPVWWVEVQARDGHPDSFGIARRLTEALVAAAGGLAWPSR